MDIVGMILIVSGAMLTWYVIGEKIMKGVVSMVFFMVALPTNKTLIICEKCGEPNSVGWIPMRCVGCKGWLWV